jgi:hypothetical protein
VGYLATIVHRSIGLFQLGDGTLIALWSAVFANTSETNKMWEICADQILCAGWLCYIAITAFCLTRVRMSYIFLDFMQGLGSLYLDTVHFRDRHTGCNVFEANILSLMQLLFSFVTVYPETCLELYLIPNIDQTRYSKRHVLCAASFAEH